MPARICRSRSKERVERLLAVVQRVHAVDCLQQQDPHLGPLCCQSRGRRPAYCKSISPRQIEVTLGIAPRCRAISCPALPILAPR